MIDMSNESAVPGLKITEGSGIDDTCSFLLGGML